MAQDDAERSQLAQRAAVRFLRLVCDDIASADAHVWFARGGGGGMSLAYEMRLEGRRWRRFTVHMLHHFEAVGDGDAAAVEAVETLADADAAARARLGADPGRAVVRVPANRAT